MRDTAEKIRALCRYCAILKKGGRGGRGEKKECLEKFSNGARERDASSTVRSHRVGMSTSLAHNWYFN